MPSWKINSTVLCSNHMVIVNLEVTGLNNCWKYVLRYFSSIVYGYVLTHCFHSTFPCNQWHELKGDDWDSRYNLWPWKKYNQPVQVRIVILLLNIKLCPNELMNYNIWFHSVCGTEVLSISSSVLNIRAKWTWENLNSLSISSSTED